MNWGLYGILIVFGLFVLLLIFNPNLSCFGRTIRSPLYPLLRKRRKKKAKAEDYGFHLVDEAERSSPKERREPIKTVKTKDYGFNLEEEKEKSSSEEKEEEG